MNRKPNFTDLGLSTVMGPQLKKFVEGQLLNDLKHYDVNNEYLKFDWSESCIEGNNIDYLDGSLENFSAICLYNVNDELVGEGWLEFIVTNQLIVYWEVLNVWDNESQTFQERKTFGIPEHIKVPIP